MNVQNGSQIHDVLQLPLKSEVIVWRERKERKWKGPYKIISKDHINVTIETINGLKTFQTTQIKPYHRTTETDQEIHNEDELYNNTRKPTSEVPQPYPYRKPRKNLLSDPTMEALQPHPYGRLREGQQIWKTRLI